MNFNNYEVYNSFVRKVKYLLSHDEYAKAASLLEGGLTKTPYDGAFQLFYATALIGLGRFREASIWVKKIILKYEESSDMSSDVDVYYYKGLNCFLEGELNQSMEYLKICFESDISYFKKLLYNKAFASLRSSDEFKRLCTPAKVFVVNEYISLRLMFSKTLIYVCDELFLTCQKVAISIAPTEFDEYANFNDIDDIISFYKSQTTVEEQQISMTSEEEFWGHCSNLQAWVENDYITNVLSKNISFPLLKELYHRGIKHFTPIFKRELIERIRTGGTKALLYFISDTEYNYLQHLTEDDLFDNLLPFEEAEIMRNISKFVPLEYTLTTSLRDSREFWGLRDDNKIHFCVKDGHIVELEILLDEKSYSDRCHEALLQVKNFNKLEELAIYYSISIHDSGVKEFVKPLDNFENLNDEIKDILCFY